MGPPDILLVLVRVLCCSAFVFCPVLYNRLTALLSGGPNAKHGGIITDYKIEKYKDNEQRERRTKNNAINEFFSYQLIHKHKELLPRRRHKTIICRHHSLQRRKNSQR